jgi:hypothetical protein
VGFAALHAIQAPILHIPYISLLQKKTVSLKILHSNSNSATVQLSEIEKVVTLTCYLYEIFAPDDVLQNTSKCGQHITEQPEQILPELTRS